MTIKEPKSQLQAQFSSEGAKPTRWAEALERLEKAEIYWLSTVRPNGRPHVTPLLSVWMDDSLYFCTGPEERKAKNLAGNPHVILTTGCDALNEGLDLVVEGDAVHITGQPTLQRLADLYGNKYGEEWRWQVKDGAFTQDGAAMALVFQVKPTTVFGFGKGEFSQTRWRF